MAAALQLGLRSLRCAPTLSSTAVQRHSGLASAATPACSSTIWRLQRGNPPVVAQAAAYQTAPAPAYSPPADGDILRRVFADYAIYKGKAAMCLKAIKPEWTHDQNGNIRVQRPGVMLLEFATADQSQGSGGYGERKYDWGKKQTFALSAAEMGNFIVSSNFQLYHDPNKGKSNENMVVKTLNVKPMTDGAGVMISLSVKDGSLPGGQVYITVPIAEGEAAVLKSIANFMIPQVLGFSEIFSQQEAAPF